MYAQVGNKPQRVVASSTSLATIAAIILLFVLTGLSIGILIAVVSNNNNCAPPPTPTPPQPTPEYPRPECIYYDPNNPPIGWPDFVAPWDQRGDIPASLRCNLIPPLVNNNSRQLFDAYQRQSLDGGDKVIFIDVRTTQEVYWVGIPTQANSITMKNGTVYVPDYYTATLRSTCTTVAPYVQFELNGVPVQVVSSDIASTQLTGISHNIPVEYLDTDTGISTLNPLWGKQCDALIRETGATRIIFFCRSGQRSSIGCYYEFCPFEQLFPGILGGQMIAYEVESALQNGIGGFEGSDYANSMLGYRGFPNRYTANSGSGPSAAFSDFGLPMDTSTLPKTVRVDPSTGATLSVDSLDAPPWASSP